MRFSFDARWWRALLVDGYRGPAALGLSVAVLAVSPAWGGAFAVPLFALGMVGNLLLVLPLATGLLLAATVVGLMALLTARRERIRRPGNSVLAGCAVLGVTALLAFSLAAPDWGMLGLGVTAAGATALVWLVRQMLMDPDEGDRPEGAWRWAVPPALLVATVALIVHQVPQQARFELSRPALTSFAEQALERDGNGLPQPEWVGALPVKDVTAVGGTGLRFTVPGGGLFEVTGYAYLPDGPPVARDGNTYTWMSGDWYRWTDNGNF
ncbi:hypothetical protein ACWEQL_14870 [Kitasatospora sp. NPDC004240]